MFDSKHIFFGLLHFSWIQFTHVVRKNEQVNEEDNKGVPKAKLAVLIFESIVVLRVNVLSVIYDDWPQEENHHKLDKPLHS